MASRRYYLTTTALASFGAIWLAQAGHTADMVTKAPVLAPVPYFDAVSGVNFKVGGFGGWQDASGGVPDKGKSGGLGGAEASLTIPVGQRFGFQIDGVGGNWGGDAFWGAGAHGFWRDPNVGLLGLTGTWTRLDRGPWPFINVSRGISAGTVGLEGEYYWNTVTLRGVAGWEGGDITSRFFTRADVRWYAQKDLMLSVGYRYTGGKSAAAFGGEWLVPSSIPGVRASLFAQGRVGDSDNRAVLAGLRLYFGKSETLIDKHRRDDPTNDLPDNLFALQQFSRSLDQQNKANYPPAPPSCVGSCVSDIRLKRDIVLLGRLPDGLGIYRYRYLWDDTAYVGVMAQEVLALDPNAVRIADDGYYRVDYDSLGLRLTEWEDWQPAFAEPVLQHAA